MYEVLTSLIIVFIAIIAIITLIAIAKHSIIEFKIFKNVIIEFLRQQSIIQYFLKINYQINKMFLFLSLLL